MESTAKLRFHLNYALAEDFINLFDFKIQELHLKSDT
jgi:hypothetical protein